MACVQKPPGAETGAAHFLRKILPVCAEFDASTPEQNVLDGKTFTNVFAKSDAEVDGRPPAVRQPCDGLGKQSRLHRATVCHLQDYCHLQD